MKKNLILVIVLVLIIGSIAYLQSKKAGTFIPQSSDSIIPAATSTDIYATSSSSPTISKADINKIIADKSKKYDRVRELVDPQGFINTDPFHIADLIGKKVILVDFWTYSCINCQRTLPYLNGWYDKYEGDGFVIIGVHSPEFEFEKNYDNVKNAVEKYGIKYPVVLDSNMGTWNAYQNRFWPAHYLVDIDGFIVDKHFGEGLYAETEKKIQDLLKERMDRLGISASVPTGTVNATYTIETNSPETYFGSYRNEFLANGNAGQSTTQTLRIPSSFELNKLYLDGKWRFEAEFAINESPAKIIYRYNAKNVYFVAKSENPITVTVKKDGVEVKKVTIQNADLYPLIEGDKMEEHTLEIDIDSPGVEAYTFTFG